MLVKARAVNVPIVFTAICIKHKSMTTTEQKILQSINIFGCNSANRWIRKLRGSCKTRYISCAL